MNDSLNKFQIKGTKCISTYLKTLGQNLGMILCI